MHLSPYEWMLKKAEVKLAKPAPQPLRDIRKEFQETTRHHNLGLILQGKISSFQTNSGEENGEKGEKEGKEQKEEKEVVVAVVVEAATMIGGGSSCDTPPEPPLSGYISCTTSPPTTF
ncbi:hypothetical protein VTI74DRAFT_2598 [Chaetomium olivicolor]